MQHIQQVNSIKKHNKMIYSEILRKTKIWKKLSIWRPITRSMLKTFCGLVVYMYIADECIWMETNAMHIIWWCLVILLIVHGHNIILSTVQNDWFAVNMHIDKPILDLSLVLFFFHQLCSIIFFFAFLCYFESQKN